MNIPIFLMFNNQSGWTKTCIKFFKEYTDRTKYRLIIIDNGSEKRISDSIKNIFDNLFDKDIDTFVRYDEQICPIYAYQESIDKFSNSEDKYFLILHNDTIVSPNWLDKMLEVAESLNGEFSVLYPRTNYANENSASEFDEKIKKNFLTIKYSTKKIANENEILLNITSLYGSLEKYEQYLSKNSEQITYRLSDDVSSFCTLYNKDLFESVGGFDFDFSSIGFETKLLCYEISNSGYSPVQALNVFVHHNGNTTTDGPGNNFFDNRKRIEKEYEKKIFKLHKQKEIRILKNTKLKSTRTDILAIRDTGIGDIIMSMFVLTGLKKEYPKCNITYLTKSKWIDFVSNFECVDSVIPVPENFESSNSSDKERENLVKIYENQFDLIFNWMLLHEMVDKSNSHRIEKYLKNIDIKGISPCCPVYNIPESAFDWLENIISVSDKKRIAVCPHATCKIRSLPDEVYEKIIETEIKNNKQVIFIGNKKMRENISKRYDKNDLIDITEKIDSVNHIFAAISSCDYIYTTDSGQLHIAGLLGIPCKEFYSSTDPKTTEGQYVSSKNNIILKKDLACVPCNDIGCQDIRCLDWKDEEIEEICNMQIVKDN